MLTEHKEICLNINSVQSVRLEKRRGEFKHFFTQIPVPFQIYADFECNLKSSESYKGPSSKNITILVVLLTKLFVLMMNLLCQ